MLLVGWGGVVLCGPISIVIVKDHEMCYNTECQTETKPGDHNEC